MSTGGYDSELYDSSVYDSSPPVEPADVYEPGLYVGPGNDDPAPTGFPQPTVDTPDPFGTADQQSYTPGEDGVDEGFQYLPPWAITRAPGTLRTVAPTVIIPIDPWQPATALLNADQLALLNNRSAARQAAAQWVDNPRQV